MTGLYTMIGGLRAVAYTDTLQTIIFIIGSAMVTVFGLIELGGWDKLCEPSAAPDMFNLWKPLVPAGMEGTWAPVEEAADGDIAWYFNDNFPLAGHVVLRPDRRPVVLVYRSVHRAAGAGGPQRDDRPARQHRRRLHEAAARVHLHRSGHDLLRLAKQGYPGLTEPGQRRHAGPRRVSGGVSADGQARAAGRACAAWSWPGCSRR